VINTILLTATIIMIGISITRFSALIEGRLIRRDLVYNAVVVSIILLIYLGLTWLAVQLFNVPSFIYIYVAVLAIISHSLVDIARRYLGRIFLRKEEQDLRSALHRLARLDEPQLDKPIDIMLKSLCMTIRATNGVLFLFNHDRVIPTAFCNHSIQECPLIKEDLLADDLRQVRPEHFPVPFAETTLLVPLYHHADQIGTILFGHPVNGIEYPQKDLDLILESSDLISETIVTLNQQGEKAAQAAQLFQTIQIPSQSEIKITPKMVEDLLRNVLDYAYLGSSEFAEFPLVCMQVGDNGSTHLDRGKCVYQILADVVEKLKPQTELVQNPPPREWHPYLILHWAYFEDTLNREIMARLYISEGTFNRTRRSALRSISRALEEMQQAVA
jgi:GAF domain-containing protein